MVLHGLPEADTGSSAAAAKKKKEEADKKRAEEEEQEKKQQEIKALKAAALKKAQKEAEDAGIDLKTEGDLLEFAGGTADFDFVSSGLVGFKKVEADARTYFLAVECHQGTS
jgi:hypothetical protein